MVPKIVEEASKILVQFLKETEIMRKKHPKLTENMKKNYNITAEKMDKIFLTLNEKERHLAEYLAEIETGDISTGNPFVRFVGKPN